MKKWADRNLLDWLNREDSAGARRVLQVITLAQEGHRFAERTRFAVSNDEYLSCTDRLSAVLSKLNATLFRYNSKTEIMYSHASLCSRTLFSSSRANKSEVVAVAFLIEYLALVHRIRRCGECQKWFFAITDHQKFCRDGCRKRRASYGEEFREKRRAYMRHYRREQQIANDRAVTLARRK